MDKMSEYEGSVAPSYATKTARSNLYEQLPMRLGRILRAYYPTDPSNYSKKFTEYDVIVDEGSEFRPSTRFTISHCVAVSAFGGAADYSTATFRTDDVDIRKSADWGNGSRVLVLMVNGSAFGGVIMGGVQHPSRGPDSQTEGHHAVWRFNGVEIKVQDSGELDITFNGASESDGSPRLSNTPGAAGSTFKLTPDGSVRLATANDGQHLFLDQSSNTTDIQAGAKATINAKLGNVEIQPTSLGQFKVGLATDQMVKGTTYRAAEAISNAAVAAGTGAAAAAWAALGALLVDPGFIAAMTLGMVTAGGSSAAVPLAAAAGGAAVGAAGAEATSATSVATMEAGGVGYLSPRSSTD